MNHALLIVKDAVLFGIAIYGAALSTFNWRRAARRDRRTVSVRVSTAILTYEIDGASREAHFAKIEATNTGNRPVTVTAIGLELPSLGRLAAMGSGRPVRDHTRLPANLSDGQSARIYFSYNEIAKALVHVGRSGKMWLTPVCEDSAGGRHKGKRWKVDTQEFARM